MTNHPGRGPSPSRIPPRLSGPRWHGDPDQRPPTDAEHTRQRRKQRTLVRFFGMLAFRPCLPLWSHRCRCCSPYAT